MSPNWNGESSLKEDMENVSGTIIFGNLGTLYSPSCYLQCHKEDDWQRKWSFCLGKKGLHKSNIWQVWLVLYI